MSDPPRFAMPGFLREEIAAAANRTEIISILTRELARSQGVLAGIQAVAKDIPLSLLYSGKADSVLRLIRAIEIGIGNLNVPPPGRDRPTN